MSIDRDRGAARRRAQWGGALLAAVAIVMTPPLGVGSYVLGVAAAGYPLEGTGVTPLAVAVVGGAVGLALVGGSVLIVSALIARPRPRPVTTAGAVSVIAGTVLFSALPLAPSVVFGLLGFPYLVAIALMGFGASACASAWMRSSETAPGPRVESDRERPAALAATLAVATLIPLSLLATGLVEAFVWGPEAQTDGLTAADVWAALSPGDAAAARAGIVVWAVMSALLSLLPALVAVLARRVPDALPVDRSRATLIAGLFAGGIVATLHWVGTFSLGMSIADTLPPYTGSLSEPAAVILGLGSFLIAIAVAGALTTRRAPRAQPRPLVDATPAR
ncbi:MAG TPA: hypothetical protein VFM95_00115 [Microcella sp.]|nr:hypothetical protein [Microcella sp.]